MGPSCFSTEQTASKKVFFIWFVNPQAIKCQHNDRFSYSDKTKSNQSEPIRSLSTQLPPVPSNIIVPSFSITDLMKARKLVKPEEQEETLMLEFCSIEGKSWERMQPEKFLIEEEKFAEGGFREAFRTTCLNPNFTRKWVLKFYKQEKAEAIQERLKISVEDNTRKQVQMHAVAHHFAVKFGKMLLRVMGYGEKLFYSKVYYTNSSKDPNTMEEYVDGQCFKYINNSGHIVDICGSSEEIKEISKRAEAFCHFTYQISNHQFMVLDIQGSV